MIKCFQDANHITKRKGFNKYQPQDTKEALVEERPGYREQQEVQPSNQALPCIIKHYYDAESLTPGSEEPLKHLAVKA